MSNHLQHHRPLTGWYVPQLALALFVLSYLPSIHADEPSPAPSQPLALNAAPAAANAHKAAQEAGVEAPPPRVPPNGGWDVETLVGREGLSSAMKTITVVTVATLAPAILILMTSFTRIVVVLSLLRHALGSPQLPPTQVIVGLSIFLTALVMAPTWNDIHEDAVKPYLAEELSREAAFARATLHIKAFMGRQIQATGNQATLFRLMEHTGDPRSESGRVSVNEVGLHVLAPAFVLSELKTAFMMGFLLYLPFLIIDLVTNSVLVTMGMMMLPPTMVSLPFKLLLFVLVDGWALVAGSLLGSFG